MNDEYPDDAVPVILLTPRWSRDIMTDPREEPLCTIDTNGSEWRLVLLIAGQPYFLPVREGEPQGEVIDVAPGIKAWGEMEHYGLSKLGPGVWKVTPSLFAAEDGLHRATAKQMRDAAHANPWDEVKARDILTNFLKYRRPSDDLPDFLEKPS